MEADQKFAIILPARKNVGGPYEDYCPRARVDVGVEANSSSPPIDKEECPSVDTKPLHDQQK